MPAAGPPDQRGAGGVVLASAGCGPGPRACRVPGGTIWLRAGDDRPWEELTGDALGLALGRWAWQAFAGSLGVGPATAGPALPLVAGTVALLAAGNLLTALPGRVAARTAPAVTLRAD